jgi:hypothetical protein
MRTYFQTKQFISSTYIQIASFLFGNTTIVTSIRYIIVPEYNISPSINITIARSSGGTS